MVKVTTSQGTNWSKFIPYIIGFAIFMFILIGGKNFLFGGPNESKTESSSTVKKEEIHCLVCSKDLTNDFNRISPNGNGNYYCTLCYQETKRQINRELRAEGYN